MFASADVRAGVEQLEQGRIEEAVKQFAAALERDPDNAAAHYYLSLALSRQ
jgi:Tfp pilus assembly protein PilF